MATSAIFYSSGFYPMTHYYYLKSDCITLNVKSNVNMILGLGIAHNLGLLGLRMWIKKYYIDAAGNYLQMESNELIKTETLFVSGIFALILVVLSKFCFDIFICIHIYQCILFPLSIIIFCAKVREYIWRIISWNEWKLRHFNYILSTGSFRKYWKFQNVLKASESAGYHIFSLSKPRLITDHN